MPISGGKNLRVAIIGTFPPRLCGIATFTNDLYEAVAAQPGVKPFVIAINDAPETAYDYPAHVRWSIDESDPAAFQRAGRTLGMGAADLILVQHEFGIFGGPAGSHIIDLLAAADLPVVTTLHTVLTDPNDEQLAVMKELIRLSHTLIVMAERGRDILMSRYGVPSRQIAVVPHGVPDRNLIEPSEMRRRLGWQDVPTVLTFGLLSPSKGLESMIDAMPALVERDPRVRYVVLGATHPHVVREQHGESYRETLMQRARKLGVEKNIVFENRFVDLPELCDCLQACDVYVTPYRSEAQITSGTLAYAHGLGKAIVSTPYWHAVELLGHRAGQLVPFDAPWALAEAVGRFLFNPEARREASGDAWRRGRSHTWPRIGAEYVSYLKGAVSQPCFEPTGYLPVQAESELRSNAA
jgi:glycosyltransferase involved in cell wall biosynthesis